MSVFAIPPVRPVMQGGARIAIGYALAAAVIFLLQLFPLTGIFLMILAGPLWIGALVHIAMAHLTIAVALRNIAPAWLAAPLVFYGGGYGLHLASVRAAQAEAARIEAANAAVRLDVGQPFAYFRSGSADTLQLLHLYRVDRVVSQQGKSFVAMSYARGEACERALPHFDAARPSEPYLAVKDLFWRYRGAGKTRQCILSQQVAGADWRYRIEGAYTYDKDRAARLYGRRGVAYAIVEERGGRTLGRIEVATLQPMPAIPWIIAGCALNSGAPSWDCTAGLRRTAPSVPAGYRPRAPDDPEKNPFIPSADENTWQVSALARALGLEPRKPTD